MKREACAALLFAVIISPAHGDQWPGQSDFSNLNGPVQQTDDSGEVPIASFAFNPPKLPHWLLPAVPKTLLTPTQYNLCKQYQYDLPTRDLSCAGPALP
jgi:hypothetical protein